MHNNLVCIFCICGEGECKLISADHSWWCYSEGLQIRLLRQFFVARGNYTWVYVLHVVANNHSDWVDSIIEFELNDFIRHRVGL